MKAIIEKVFVVIIAVLFFAMMLFWIYTIVRPVVAGLIGDAEEKKIEPQNIEYLSSVPIRNDTMYCGDYGAVYWIDNNEITGSGDAPSYFCRDYLLFYSNYTHEVYTVKPGGTEKTQILSYGDKIYGFRAKSKDDFTYYIHSSEPHAYYHYTAGQGAREITEEEYAVFFPNSMYSWKEKHPTIKWYNIFEEELPSYNPVYILKNRETGETVEIDSDILLQTAVGKELREISEKYNKITEISIIDNKIYLHIFGPGVYVTFLYDFETKTVEYFDWTRRGELWDGVMEMFLEQKNG